MISAEDVLGFSDFAPSPGAPTGPMVLRSLQGQGLNADLFDGGASIGLPLCITTAGTLYAVAWLLPNKKRWLDAGGTMLAVEETPIVLWNNGEAVKPKSGDVIVQPIWSVAGVTVAPSRQWKIRDVEVLAFGAAYQCNCAGFVP